MKKMIMAAVAALMVMPAVAQADEQTIGNNDCAVELVSINDGNEWKMSNESVSCLKATFIALENSRKSDKWSRSRLYTQINYYNKVVSKLNSDLQVNQPNGAYWGDVTGARDTIQSLYDTITASVAANEAAEAATEAAETELAGTTESMCNYIKDLRRIVEDSTDIMIFNVGNGKESTCSNVGVDINGGNEMRVDVHW